MPLLKRKGVEDLLVGRDMLYSRAGNIAPAGAPVTDSLKPDFLLERKPDLLFRQGIYAGSLGIYGSTDANGQYDDRKAILDCLDEIYSLLETMEAPQLYLDSIRLGAIYDAGVKDSIIAASLLPTRPTRGACPESASSRTPS